MGDTALEKIKKAKDGGALVFVNEENFMSAVPLYKTEVTILAPKVEDFHKINGKHMPTKNFTDRIGEANGVQFIPANCRVTTETREDDVGWKRAVYVAQAQGKIRMPDGSWRESTVEDYEFDPVLRAMLDKNVTVIDSTTRQVVARTIQEYSKVGRQRASTGARLRVIRQLTGMPTAFPTDEIKKDMVFTRVVQNTDYILQTKEGRTLATAQALGMDVSALFGQKNGSLATPEAAADEEGAPPERNVTPEPEAAAAPPPDNPDPWDEEETQFQKVTRALEEFMHEYKDTLSKAMPSGHVPYALAESELNNPEATVETRKAMLGRITEYLARRGIKL
jgi:hypothetical protein